MGNIYGEDLLEKLGFKSKIEVVHFYGYIVWFFLEL